jgi:hypothetical protein
VHLLLLCCQKLCTGLCNRAIDKGTAALVAACLQHTLPLQFQSISQPAAENAPHKQLMYCTCVAQNGNSNFAGSTVHGTPAMLQNGALLILQIVNGSKARTGCCTQGWCDSQDFEDKTWHADHG